MIPRHMSYGGVGMNWGYGAMCQALEERVCGGPCHSMLDKWLERVNWIARRDPVALARTWCLCKRTCLRVAVNFPVTVPGYSM